MKTCKEMAKLWGVTERTVTTFCKTGKIPGAVKEGKSWRIPDEAEKPVDGRILSGKYVKKEEKEAKKPLPIGISDYVRAQSEYYYVDKTGMIKEFLDRKPLVSLFTRPRRFGKTLNMDMLRVFFEISDTDTSQYFRDKETIAMIISFIFSSPSDFYILQKIKNFVKSIWENIRLFF